MFTFEKNKLNKNDPYVKRNLKCKKCKRELPELYYLNLVDSIYYKYCPYCRRLLKERNIKRILSHIKKRF